MVKLKGTQVALGICLAVCLFSVAAIFFTSLKAPVVLSLSVRETPSTLDGIAPVPLAVHLLQESGSVVRVQFDVERDSDFHEFEVRLPQRDYSKIMLEFGPNTPWVEIHSIRLSGFFRSHVWKAEDIAAEFHPLHGVSSIYVRDIGDEGPNANGIRRSLDVEKSPEDPRQDMDFFEVRRDAARIVKDGQRIQILSQDISQPYAWVSDTKSGYYIIGILLSILLGTVCIRWFNLSEISLSLKRVLAREAGVVAFFAIILAVSWGALTSPIAMYWGALAWAFIVAVSIVGWGDLLQRLAMPGKKIPWPLASAWGLAVLLFLGGVLNAFSMISQSSIFCLLALGVVSLVMLRLLPQRNKVLSVLAHPRRAVANPVMVILWIGVLVFLAARLGAYVHTSDYGMVRHIPVFYVNAIDDMAAYAVYPEKILATGSIGYNPFGERQVTSSFGGQYFLHTFLQVLLAPENLLLMESLVCFVFLLAMVYALLRMEGVSPFGAWLFFALTSYFLITPQINTTSISSGMVLTLGLYMTLRYYMGEDSKPIPNGLILGLLVAALCSLKNTFIPPTGLLMAGMYVSYLFKSKEKSKVLIEFAAATGFVVACVLPWLYAIYETSGPSFWGSMSAQASRPGDSPAMGMVEWAGMAAAIFKQPFYVALFISSMILLVTRKRDDLRNTHIMWVLSGVITSGLVFFIFKGFGNAVYRYSYATNQLTILIGLVIIFQLVDRSLRGVADHSAEELTRKWRKHFSEIVQKHWGVPLREAFTYTPKNYLKIILAILILLLLSQDKFELGVLHQDTLTLMKQNTTSARSRLSNQFHTPLFSRTERLQIEHMQTSVPEGEVLFAHLDKPLLLDFNRNPVHVVDFPSNALMPESGTFQDHEGIAELLRQQDIRYVTYAYGNESFFTFERFKYKLMGVSHNLAKISTQRTLDFQGSLGRLGNEYLRLYDDGKYFVLDLDSPVNNSVADGFQFMPSPLDSEYYSYPRDREFYNVTWEVDSIPHLLDQSTLYASAAKLTFRGFHVNPGDTFVARIVYTGFGLHLTALYDGDETENGLKTDFGKVIFPIAEGISEYYQVITVPDNVLPNRDHFELNFTTGNFNSFTGRFEGRFTGDVLLRSVALVKQDSGALLGLYNAYPFGSNPGILQLSNLANETKISNGFHDEFRSMAELTDDSLVLNDTSSRAASVYIASMSNVNIDSGSELLMAITHRGSGFKSFFILEDTESSDGIRHEYGFGELPGSDEWVRTIYPLNYPAEALSNSGSVRFVFSIGAYDRQKRSYNVGVRGVAEIAEMALIEEKSGRIVGYWYPSHPDIQNVESSDPEEQTALN